MKYTFNVEDLDKIKNIFDDKKEISKEIKHHIFKTAYIWTESREKFDQTINLLVLES